MRYEPGATGSPAPRANTEGTRHRPASALRLEELNRATQRQAVELDDWENEGGTPASQTPQAPRRAARRHFDEFSG